MAENFTGYDLFTRTDNTFTTEFVIATSLVGNHSGTPTVPPKRTTNEWASFHDTDASFNGNVPVAVGLSQVEIWKFKTPELNLDQTLPISNLRSSTTI